MRTFYRVCSDGTIRFFTEEDVKYGAFRVISHDELWEIIEAISRYGGRMVEELGDNQEVEFDGDGNCIVVDENFDDGSGFPAAG